MTKSKHCETTSATYPNATPPDSRRYAPEAPADILARGWIAALRRLNPVTGDLAGERGGTHVADDWTVETVLKLGYTAPDRAYDVAVRIVELSDDPWILANVGVGVLEDLLRRDEIYFRARLSADADRLPHLRHTLARMAPARLGAPRRV